METVTGFAWDSNWYEIEVPEGAQGLLISLDFIHSAGDLDLYLYDQEGNEITNSSSSTDNEFIEVTAPEPGIYYVQVFPFEVTGNEYVLSLDILDADGDSLGGDDNYEVNNTLTESFDLRGNRGNYLSEIAGLGVAWDSDVYQIEISEDAQQLAVALEFNHSAGDLDLYLYDQDGNQVTSATSATDNEFIDIVSPNPGTYYLEVYPYELTGNTYDLFWEAAEDGGGDDNYELNNTLSEAFDLRGNEGDFLSEIAGLGVAWDSDVYQIEISEDTQQLAVSLDFSHEGGDLDLYLYDQDGNQVTSATSTTDNEFIEIANPEPGNYYVEVYPYEVTGNTYDLNWEASEDDGEEPDDSSFQIDLVFVEDVSETQRQAFEDAAKRWEDIIIGDLPNAFSSELGQEIDDLVIQVAIAENDGVGGVLGFAGPSEFRRDGSFFPIYGEMSFDAADMQSVEEQALLTDLIIHEMGHVIGLGTIWDNLLEGNGTSDPGFLGLQAINAYNNIFRTNDGSVPVEADGGTGTAYGHWDEEIFGNELMTGFLNEGKNPISLVSVAALADLGYEVNLDAADDYDPFRTSAVSIQAVRTSFDFHSNSYLITGNNQDNEIEGTGGNDLLNGGAGKDLIRGRRGQDTLMGGDGKDTLDGGKGGDVLIGDQGKDLLIGGQGADKFVINLTDSNKENIEDFSNRDTLVIIARDFDEVELEPLGANWFSEGDTATERKHRVLYDNGDVFWDSDGTGDSEPFLIATLKNGFGLDSDHILVDTAI